MDVVDESSKTIAEFWHWYEHSRQQAFSYNIPVAELDWLITRVTSLDKLALRLKQLSAVQVLLLTSQLEYLQKLWQQRQNECVPVQYLAGTTTWRNLELSVSPAVLIPRPETELLIDLVAEINQSGIWVDLGTGSGAIALGLAQALPISSIHAVDCSSAALEIAKVNAKQCGLSDRIQFHLGSWFEPLTAVQHQITGMVSNPPYIPTAEIARLEPHVAKHEPHLALDGGADGLDVIRHLINTAPQYLISGGHWLVELMIGQAELVQTLLQAHGNYHHIQIHRDCYGINRFVSAIVA